MTRLKHIKKRYVTTILVGPQERQGIASIAQNKVAGNIKDENTAGFDQGLLFPSNSDAIGAFAYVLDGVKHLIPEPDYVCLNFDAAYIHWKHLIKARIHLIAWLKMEPKVELPHNQLYGYFGTAMLYINTLFTSLEAAMNRCIPKGYEHRTEKQGKVTTLNKEGIQRYMDMNDKLKIIKSVTKKDFALREGKKMALIQKLKDVRDLTTHPKDEERGIVKYPLLYTALLDFDFDNTIIAAMDFINYYSEKSLIEECTCGHTENDYDSAHALG